MMTSLRVVCLVAGAGLLVTSCQTPKDGDETVRRAEPAEAGPTSALNVPVRSGELNQMARVLAGMENGKGNAGIVDNRSWAYHKVRMDAMWRRYELGRGQKVRSWAAEEIGDLQRYGAAFYPFSGPDFLYLQDLFPSARTYILCGLEPAEPLPDLRSLTTAEIEGGLDGLRTALDGIINAGYFVTKDMRSDLQTTRFKGTLPILLATLARSGASIDSITVVQLDASGSVVQANVSGGAAPGLMIRFRSGNGGSRTLYYFRQDLSNGATKQGGPFLTFVANQGTPPALVKSASYLMHGSSFSNIRNYLLTSTPGFVQDPSGVPYRDIVNAGLGLDLYGNYENTLGIFSQQQPDLVNAYRNGQHKVESVSFGFGYLYRPATTSIMVARRRQ